jgi:hypothetical protein
MAESFAEKLRKLETIIARAPGIDRRYGISREEFVERRRRVWAAVQDAAAVDAAFAFSDEHYSGEVPYLGGNTNCSIEQVAFGLGPDPFRSGIIAGFEGVYVAGQLAPRAGAAVYPTESLQLADEKYPVEGFSLKDILEKIAGKTPRRVGLLTPRQVFARIEDVPAWRWSLLILLTTVTLIGYATVETGLIDRAIDTVKDKLIEDAVRQGALPGWFR